LKSKVMPYVEIGACVSLRLIRWTDFFKILKSVSHIKSFLKIPIFIYIDPTKFTSLHAVSW